MLTLPAAAQPVVRDVEVSLAEDSEARGQVAVRDVASAKLKKPPKHGQASVDATTGEFVYTPAKDFVGDDGFVVEVGSATSKKTASSKVTVHVAGENDAPVAKPLSLSCAEDGVAKGQVPASDVDKDLLTFHVSVPPQHGLATVDARGNVTYRPAKDWNGVETFTVEVSDGALTALSEVTATVAAVNDGPIVRGGAQGCREDEPCTATLDTFDADGDALTFKVTSKPKHGELALDAATGQYTFTAQRDFHGEDAFAAEVSDGKLKASVTMALHVAPVNDAPVAQPLSLSTQEDVPVSGRAVASDVDLDALSWRVSRPAAHGTAMVDARSGQVTFVPARDFFGADAFALEVTDGQAPVTFEVPVSIASVNDAPVAKHAALTVDEDGTLTGQCEAHDVDGDALAFKLGRNAAHGALTFDEKTGAFKYVPARDYHGPDGFSFQVSDGKLGAEGVVRLTVKPVNDAPVSQPMVLSSDEDVAVYGAAVATDVDADFLTWEVATAPQHGKAHVDAKSGAVKFEPAANYHGTDAFTLRVSDGKGASHEAPVAVSLKPVDDAPVAKPFTLESLEDAVANNLLPGWDVDGDPLTYRIVSQPRLGSVLLTDASSGAWRFQPSPDANGEDEFTFEVTDGRTTARGAVKLHVKAVEDAPVVAELQLASQEDEAAEGDVHAFDVDGELLKYEIASPPKQGTASVDANGKVKFTPAKDQYGSVTFAVKASDGIAWSEPAKVTVNLAPVNDTPVAKAGTLATDEDMPSKGTVHGHDVDGDALSYAVAKHPAHGKVVVHDAAKGHYTYTPHANWFGNDVFTFAVTDEKGATSMAEVTVAVSPVNDAPEAEVAHVTGPCNGTVTGRLTGFDRESKTVTYKIASEPKRGRVTLNEKTGEFVFYSDGQDYDGQPVQFGYEVFDGQGASATADVFVHPSGACTGRGG